MALKRVEAKFVAGKRGTQLFIDGVELKYCVSADVSFGVGRLPRVTVVIPVHDVTIDTMADVQVVESDLIESES